MQTHNSPSPIPHPQPERPAGAVAAPSSALGSWLVIVVSALLCLGALMVFSAGSSLDQQFDLRQFWRYPILRRVAFVPIVWLILAVAARIDYRWLLGAGRSWWRTPILWLLVLSLAALVLVLAPGIGIERNYSRRWLRIGAGAYGVVFQPSELAKWVTVLFLAGYAAWRGAGIRRFWSGFLPGLAVLLAVVGLIGKEDFGTAALVGLAGAIVLLIAGARWWHMLVLLPVAVLAFYLFVYSSAYRWERVMAYFQPSAEREATAYQAQQSLIAIGHSGLRGAGLGEGTMKMGFLPEDTTDFNFSVIAEELGFGGAVLVTGLYLAMMWCCILLMQRARDRLGRLAVIAVAVTIGGQALMNLLVVTGMAPTKGIALPFISAGGSGLVVTAVATGVLINIARQSDGGARLGKPLAEPA